MFKLCSLCWNPQVIFPWIVARFRTPLFYIKAVLCFRGKASVKGRPEHPFTLVWHAHEPSLVLPGRFCNTTLHLVFYLENTLTHWSEIKATIPKGLSSLKGFLSLFSAHLMHTCLPGELSMHYWTYLTSRFSSCASRSPQAIGEGIPMPQMYSERLVSSVGFETL